MTVVGTETVDEKKETEVVNEVKSEDINEKHEKDNMFDKVDVPSEIDTNSENQKEVEEMSQLPVSGSSAKQETVKINKEAYNKANLVITAKEKSDFIDSIISGDRYRQRYSLFGGRLSVVIRNRTAAETNAMYSYIRYILAKNDNKEHQINIAEGDMAYIPLVVQIEEINGVKFPEMKEPLTYTESNGEEIKPGWYEDFLAWKKKPEGLTSALISMVQLFEYKYWTMTKEASNKNFWNTDTSIEK